MVAATAERQRTNGADGSESTAQRLAKLAGMRDKAGKLTYERVRLAVAVFKDRDWIAVSWQGDPNAAAEHLQDEFLGDLCGAVSFLDLVRVYDLVPAREDWERMKWNLKRLLAEADLRQPKPERQGEPRTRKVVSIKDHEEEIKLRKDAEYQVKRSNELLLNKDEQIVALKEEVSRLKQEAAKLTGRIEELERQLRLRAS